MKNPKLLWVLAALILLAPRVQATVRYVDLNCTNATPPYTDWNTASTDIQSAIDAASDGDEILVTNGVYQCGGRVIYGSLTNRVAVTRQLTVESVNGPSATVIQGNQVSNTINGDDAVRCVYLTNNAALFGFTLAGGATRDSGDGDKEQSGGGVWCESSDAVISNCVITGDAANLQGGGAMRGTLSECVLSNNLVPLSFYGPYAQSQGSGGGAQSSILNHCLLAANYAGDAGGGASGGVLNDCVLANNSVNDSGGAAASATLNDCAVTNNSAGYGGGGVEACVLNGCVVDGNFSFYGGGASNSTLTNCTLAANSGNTGGGALNSTLVNCALSGNSAYDSEIPGTGGGTESCTLNNCTLTFNTASVSGGADNSTLNNCIVYYNSAPSGANSSGSTFYFSCTTPLPDSGTDNITFLPQLTDAYHISAGSPCLGAGSAAYARGTDIDGDAWLNPPSIGCDEFASGSLTGVLAVVVSADYTNCATGYTLNFLGAITGHASACVWDFGDGTTLTNQLFDIRHSWAAAGDFAVTLTAFNNDNPGGAGATVIIHVAENPLHYVSSASVNPVSPFTSWATAATNIQDAVDAAFVGGTVLVTNGIYSTGGHIVYGSLTNRVAVTKLLTVQSVNGPDVTLITGQPENDHIAVRCAYLTYGAVLNGFTLTNGGTLPVWYEPPDEDLVGGGIRGETNAVIMNCVLINNSSGLSGGGAYGGILNHCTLAGNFSWHGAGANSSILNDCMLSNNVASYYGYANGGGANSCTLNNCTLLGNFADNSGAAEMCMLDNCAITGNSADGSAGGVDNSTLNNCTLTGNSASSNGGASASTLNNCIVYYNQATTTGPNYSSCILNYCCTPTLPTNGIGNFTSEPQLADAFHISTGSPCRGTGNTAYVTGADIDGDAWANPPSIGCDEYYADAITGTLAVSVQADYTNVATGFNANFTAEIAGHADFNAWNFGDGTIVSNRPYAEHSYTAGGDYSIVFTAYNDSNPAGVSAALTMHVESPLHYVAQDNPNPVSPYNSWTTAATNIQDAVDAAFVGGTIIVSNGLYQIGGLVINGLTNRVALTKPMNLQSINGPDATAIQGYQVPVDADAGGAVRCVYLADRTTMSGFTLTNGSSGQGSGGAWCETVNVVVSNCVITGNLNGGINNAVMNNCVLANNDSGASSCTLNDCLITNNNGGGIQYCVANRCNISGNSSYNGGGAYWSTLNNCVVANNYATHEGGGMYIGDANSCLFTGNSAGQYSGPGLNVNFNNCTIVNNADGPGVSWLNNCIVYNNTAWNSDAYSTFNNCCTIPLPPGGTGNFTNDPAFVDAANDDFRLQTNSPCINAGNNNFAPGAKDLGGNPRIAGGTVDSGAYEFQSPASIISYAWLRQYGLPIDGSADSTDSDGDGLNNWQEWIAGTDPTNPLSVLKLVSLTSTNNSPGITVTWQSAAGVNYFLQRCTNLMPSTFSNIQSNIAGQDGSTSYTDPTATNCNAFFYRVGVQ